MDPARKHVEVNGRFRCKTPPYFFAARLAHGDGTAALIRWSSPRVSSSHCTSSPGSIPMAAASARGTETYRRGF